MPWINERTYRNRNDRQPSAAYNLELSFRLDEEDTVMRRRRLTLVSEALRAIQDRDERLLSWFLRPASSPDWVHIRAVVTVDHPGQAADLSEQWMATAISAANLADDADAARLPNQRRNSAGHISVNVSTTLA